MGQNWLGHYDDNGIPIMNLVILKSRSRSLIFKNYSSKGRNIGIGKGIGRYTYYSPMGASTIDYVLLKEDNMISKFKALPKLVESDHCPIKFHNLNSNLKELSSAKINIHVNDSSPCSNVYIWQDEKTIEYQASLGNEQTCIAFEKMLCAVAEGCNSDNLCDIFNDMFENTIYPLFSKKQHNIK